jgi:hypothetical protein
MKRETKRKRKSKSKNGDGGKGSKAGLEKGGHLGSLRALSLRP